MSIESNSWIRVVTPHWVYALKGGPKGSLPVPQNVSHAKIWFLIGALFLSVSPVFATSAPAKPVGKSEVDKSGLIAEKKIPFSGYSEGIDFHDGYLWNAVPTLIRKIDPQTGEVLASFAPPTSYSESLCWVGKNLWNVSYADNGIYRALLSKDGKSLAFKRLGTTPEVHAWGLTYNGAHLLMTGDHGSSKIYFVSPQTLKTVRALQVDASDLEDLAWDGEGIWTSSFTSQRGKIFRVDPKTGKFQGIFNIPEPEMCPVVDGIAVDGKFLWITGKNCPSIYKVRNPLKK